MKNKSKRSKLSKSMKKWESSKEDEIMDKLQGYKEGSKEDRALDESQVQNYGAGKLAKLMGRVSKPNKAHLGMKLGLAMKKIK